MSKLYQLNRMTNSAAAGGPLLAGAIGTVGKFFGGLFKSKAARAAAAAAKQALKNPAVQAGLAGGAGAVLLGATYPSSTPATRGEGGASGYWGRRRRKGITATELRGFRKVAKLLHNEGMVIKKRRHA